VKTKCVLAEFNSPAALLVAAKKAKEAGYTVYDAYSPFPIHGMDDAMGLGQSKLDWIVLIGGAFGLVFGFGLQTWVATSAYKLVISGKPLFSFQAFVPVTFELMVLFAAFSAVFGMFAFNKLPQFYHPIFRSVNFRKVTSHAFFIGIESTDPLFNEKETLDFLEKIGGSSIELIKENDEK
jgi:hypothetical protein